ncbi:DUF3817 domain-containing protein [Actinokineospora iranica]|uniref:Integral membrane protein n=1 Tax=Actinokineospora iranica TaxID=1271860 RepID=A0A1G6N112_9PSEU|nr:DUF3817 domain-containing protein [Actinokineospora iranica]SDC60906.1 integral membrane protein [Actinokineospora iranica]
MFDTPAGRFRAVAIAEAASWLGLLVGMFFKYVTETGELGVKIFGPIHGAIFIAYVVVTAFSARQLGWNRRAVVWAFVCGVPPLATLIFERWALRTGKLDPVAVRRRSLVTLS